MLVLLVTHVRKKQGDRALPVRTLTQGEKEEGIRLHREVIETQLQQDSSGDAL
jgi:hypothetical protein